MANYCIPPDLAKKLIDAARQGDSVGDIAKLSDMNSEERRAAFAKHVGEHNARDINAEFEKVLATNRAKALEGWVKNTFSGAAKRNGQQKSALDKIQELNEKGLLTPEDEEKFYEDLVSDKLGISISPEQAKIISDKATRLETLAEQTDELGLPTNEFFKAKEDLENYIREQSPASNLRVFTSTIRRGMMLASLKSPIVNIESNTVQAVLTAMERRMADNRYTGLNSDLANKYWKKNMSVFKDSGYDLSRMMSYSDNAKIVGEEITHSQGEGAVRALGRGVEDVVFKYMMGAPDVAFSSFHFADSANLASSKMALSEGHKGDNAKNRARAIMLDAMQVEPKSIEGQMVRSQAIADAEYATYTNTSRYTKATLKMREALNAISGDVRAGDQIMPFVKTPANVVGAGIEFSGVGLPVELALLPKAIIQAKRGDTGALKQSVRSIVRSGLGLTFAFLLSQVIDPEDFIGNYPTSEKERKLFEMRNGVANSIKVGGEYISLDYMGVLAAPFIGMMYAKKYGQNETDKILQYYKGVGNASLKMPGPKEFVDLWKGVSDFVGDTKSGTDELATAGTNIALDYLRSAVVPSIVNDISIATDKPREADIKQDPLARIKAAIPGLRQGLPEKDTTTGEKAVDEPGWKQMLFGSRVKTANEQTLNQELVRLDTVGQLPAITDIEKTDRVERLKEQLNNDRQYNAAISYYKQLFKNGMERTIQTGKYKQATDEDKKDMIEDVKDDAVNTMLKKYRYKAPKKKQPSKSKKSMYL